MSNQIKAQIMFPNDVSVTIEGKDNEVIKQIINALDGVEITFTKKITDIERMPRY